MPSIDNHSHKVAIYTAIFGEIDKPKKQCLDGASFTAYLSNPEGNEHKQAMPKYQNDPRRSSRWYKMSPHILFPDWEYTLWLDGNISLLVPVKNLIDRYLVSSDIAIFQHPYRDNIYDEANMCVTLNKEKREVLDKQLDRYFREGYNGKILGETGIMLRRNTEKNKEFNELWMREIEQGSVRDQISFGYCAWRTDSKVTFIEGDMRKRPEFDFTYHN